ncbi:MAG: DUF427 domain-containing protein [Microcoleaceae cyanobacterium]
MTLNPDPKPLSPGQESVWDYPRPPRLEESTKLIQVVFNQVMIAETYNAKRVLETSHPPTYYIPPEDVKLDYLMATAKTSWCEWKGQAAYCSILVGDRQVVDGAWYYPNPTPNFAGIQDYIAVYPGRMDACYVDGEQVQAQAGDFYGGWVTKAIIGPFKGGPGTWGW